MAAFLAIPWRRAGGSLMRATASGCPTGAGFPSRKCACVQRLLGKSGQRASIESTRIAWVASLSVAGVDAVATVDAWAAVVPAFLRQTDMVIRPHRLGEVDLLSVAVEHHRALLLPRLLEAGGCIHAVVAKAPQGRRMQQ